jgi:hypothetical protein
MTTYQANVLDAHRTTEMELLNLLAHLRTPIAISRAYALAECVLRSRLRYLQVRAKAVQS